MHLLITGPKHSGKTTAGRALAAATGREFIDLDGEIGRATGKSPRELYREGPDIFRAEEARALARALSGAGRIIAAGGGLCDNPDALALLAGPPDDRGVIIVALEAGEESAWERIVRGGELPPFLEGPDPRSVHRALHARRTAAYRALADIILTAEGAEGPLPGTGASSAFP